MTHPYINGAVQGALLMLCAVALFMELRKVYREWQKARKIARENGDGA